MCKSDRTFNDIGVWRNAAIVYVKLKKLGKLGVGNFTDSYST